ncbi:energy transducer TonB [Flavobacterium cheongpyeongense]|uniref:Energy transducer TonB n=1 Tax=Flavobacterium cheongpyeongense TaxID=2212651 RepID=A0A2V4C5W0_9FLAO|nr:energy transducer TonB [Flavobacterium cheongpyeongense]PXY41584.1 energy transducer TonB [Flavobacterium cheongpyeongense]
MKKKLLIALLFSLPILLLSQNSTDKIIYSDSIGKDASKENHSFYRIIKDYYNEKDTYQVKDYYKSGVLKMESISKTKDGYSREGECTHYYENGKKKRTENYLKSRLNGIFSEWYENGNPKLRAEYVESEKGFSSDLKIYDFWNTKNEQIVKNGNGTYEEIGEKYAAKGNVKNGFKDGEWKGINEVTNYQYTDIYDNGKFISGKSINSEGKERQYTVLESRPLPEKGISDFYKFIGANFTKTKEAVLNKISGRLVVQFVIERDGKIVEPKILKSLGYGLDEEAMRVVTSYENWIPGQQRGMPVRVLYSIPITVSN